jgi:hypothetical protein
LIDPFSAFGAGLSVVDGEPVGTLVYAYGDDGAAEDAVATVEDVLTNGTSIAARRPLSDLFDVREVRADDGVVVATVSFRESNPGIVWNMIYQRDLPTISG